MPRNGFTLIEAVVATSLAAAALVTLLLVRQNSLVQTTRATELNTAATTAQNLIDQWRISDSSEQSQISLSGTIKELELSWVCELEDVEVLPEQWMPSLVIRFFAKSNNNKEPIAFFAGIKYSQEPVKDMARE